MFDQVRVKVALGSIDHPNASILYYTFHNKLKYEDIKIVWKIK